jgi:hypothetical protein
MNIYKISREDLEADDYDTFKSAVVCAEDEDTARNIRPNGDGELMDWCGPSDCSAWCESPDMVKVELIGIAVPGLQQSVICADFIAA